MPPRCAVPSPTAALRPLPTCQDGIWITDAMLVRAIERYQRVSTTSCRHLSSLPGPIESRRRLGKRHMTAIMPGSHTSPAPWAIDIPWQVGEWKWEAPTAPNERNRKTKKPGMPRILDRLIGWLEDLDEETTLTQSPSAAESAPPTRLQETIVTIQQQIKDMGSIEKTKPVIELCQELEKDVEAIIQLHMATSQDLLLAFDLINSDLRTVLHNEAYWDRVTASIGKTIVDTILKNQAGARPDAYGTRFWFSFIEKICRLTPQRETFNLFASCMNALPKAHFDLLSHEDFFNMTRCFIVHQASKSTARPAAVLEFSKAFKRLTPEHTKCLLESLVTLLQSLPEGEIETRFHVAALVAHNGQVSTNEFLQILSQIRQDGCWSTEQVFSFMRGRLWASKCIAPKHIAPFMRQTADSQGWVSLVLHAFRAPEHLRSTILKELCYLSSQLNCFETLVQALASELPHRSSVFRDLAIACEDHRLAIKLWVALSNGQRGVKNTGSWNWTAWSSYLECMIKDPSVDQGLIWKIIATDQTPAKNQHQNESVGGIKSKTQLLEMMSKWYLEAPHLNDRQALRRVQNCINHYGRISPTISAVAISNLVQVVLRDLERGCFGRTTRLDYVVSLIHKHLGKTEAEAALTQIRGWRWTIQNHNGPSSNLDSEKKALRHDLEVGSTRPQGEPSGEAQHHGLALEEDAFAQMKQLRRDSV